MRTAPYLRALLLAALVSSCVGSSGEQAPVPSGAPLVGHRDLDVPLPRPSVGGPVVQPVPGEPHRHSPLPGRPFVAVPRPVSTSGNQAAQGGPAAAHRASGIASWYCGHGSACTRGYPSGLYAAAGPALRVGDWRGRVVSVRSAGRVVHVRLIDTCQCYGSRVVDLYSDVWAALDVPLSRGVMKVSVSW